MPTEHVRILLIEDDPADARLIRELLSESKEMTFEVEGAETLAEGIARLPALRPDVVMLDLGLPDSVGLDTVRRLYAQAGGRHADRGERARPHHHNPETCGQHLERLHARQHGSPDSCGLLKILEVRCKLH